ELREYDSDWLRHTLGERALELQARACGVDVRGVESERLPKSYGEENTFERDVLDRDTISAALTAHSEAVARRVRHDGYRGRTVTLKEKFAERRAPGVGEPRAQQRYPMISRQRTLRAPTDDAALIRHVALALWDEEMITAPVRLVGVSLSGLLECRAEQLELFEPRAPIERVGPTLDAIQRRFGESAIRRGAAPPTKVTPSSRLKRGE